MSVRLYNTDNVEWLEETKNAGIMVDVIYADMIYDNKDLEWIKLAYNILNNNGIMYVQTDYHTAAEVKLELDWFFGSSGFVNWLIYINEWGGTSSRFFPRKHDDILMYAKGKDYKFYPERIKIPKITAGTKFDKRGDGVKTPCDVFYDHISFSTVANERVKDGTGHNIQWQKPMWLMDRLLLTTTDVDDTVCDPFVGSGTTPLWCLDNNRHFIGTEVNKDVFEMACKRISEFTKTNYITKETE